eukprot:SAG11_NODE_14216_length_621_cov_0.825670_2_plen_83_part_01
MIDMLFVMHSHGWQLGEHGEWAKHTDFGALSIAAIWICNNYAQNTNVGIARCADIATHTPMILHVPGVTDSPRMSRVTNAFSE